MRLPKLNQPAIFQCTFRIVSCVNEKGFVKTLSLTSDACIKRCNNSYPPGERRDQCVRECR